MGHSNGVVEGCAARAVVNLRFVYALRDCPRELIARTRILADYQTGATTGRGRGAVGVSVAEVRSRNSVTRVESDADHPA